MNTETLNNFETTQMVTPTGMEVTSVDTPVDMPNNIAPTVKDQFSTGQKICLAVGIAGIVCGAIDGIYFLVKKVKAKRASKAAKRS